LLNRSLMVSPLFGFPLNNTHNMPYSFQKDKTNFVYFVLDIQH